MCRNVNIWYKRSKKRWLHRYTYSKTVVLHPFLLHPLKTQWRHSSSWTVRRKIERGKNGRSRVYIRPLSWNWYTGPVVKSPTPHSCILLKARTYYNTWSVRRDLTKYLLFILRSNLVTPNLQKQCRRIDWTVMSDGILRDP